MKRPVVLAILCTSLASCSPDQYQRSADIAVERILRDRKQETLGYRPQTEAKVTGNPEPLHQSYEPIPVTPIAPPSDFVFERAKVRLSPVPLGPQRFDYDPNTPLDLVPQEMLQFSNGSTALGPPAPDGQLCRLDLFQAIAYGVQHSRPYQDRMEDLFLATLDVTLQRHLFEPRPFMQSSVGFAGGQQDVNYRSALLATNTVGIKQQLPYGGEIVAKQLVSTVSALNNTTQDGQTASVALTASIPLLQGAGLVNLEPLINSERELVYAVRDFETYRRNFVLTIASQYFRLINQQQNIANRRHSYESLSLLTERTQALFQAGTLSYLDVQRSLQNQLSAQTQLIVAINGYQTALDDFKIALGMDVQENLEIAPVALDIAVPPRTPEQAAETALKYRLDLKTAADRTEDARRGVSNAKNGLLPGLNFQASGLMGSRPEDSLGGISDDTATYAADVTLDWPLDRVAERNAYRRALILFERAQRNLVTARENVIADVRETSRSTRTAEETLKIQKRSLELAQRRLDLATELLIQGKKGALDVVDAETALLNAQDAVELAKTNLQILILQYFRDTGTLRIDPQAGALGQAMDRAAAQERENITPSPQ